VYCLIDAREALTLDELAVWSGLSRRSVEILIPSDAFSKGRQGRRTTVAVSEHTLTLFRERMSTGGTAQILRTVTAPLENEQKSTEVVAAQGANGRKVAPARDSQMYCISKKNNTTSTSEAAKRKAAATYVVSMAFDQMWALRGAIFDRLSEANMMTVDRPTFFAIVKHCQRDSRAKPPLLLWLLKKDNWRSHISDVGALAAGVVQSEKDSRRPEQYRENEELMLSCECQDRAGHVGQPVIHNYRGGGVWQCSGRGCLKRKSVDEGTIQKAREEKGQAGQTRAAPAVRSEGKAQGRRGHVLAGLSRREA
jgi:hypothetical protein